MAGLSSQGIFLSYRREDTALYARLLQVELSHRIPKTRVFMDLDSIEPGLDFAEVIREAVDSCIVLVALIGPQWATLADEEGRPRLDDPDDWVRFEIRSALKRGVRVIPVLVDGARPPRPRQLPVELHPLARIQAHELSNNRYIYDADQLLSLLQRIVVEAAGTGTGRQSPPGPNVEAFTDSPGVSANRKTSPTGAERTAEPISITLSTGHDGLRGVERPAPPVIDLRENAFVLVTAKALAATDPDRAAQFLADAERAAQSMTDDSLKARTLARIAEARAATGLDP